MLRKLFAAVLVCLLPALAAAQTAPTPPVLAAKSWLLLEFGSDQILASQNPDERVEPASLTKLMTAYLSFAALRQKTLALNQPVNVSEKAWRTGGSKMFIRVGDQVPVEDLIRGMIIQSGNDACVALAEAISGSEEAFAALMNREAQRLGMKNTQFRNSTGLPDPQHYTTASDLAKLAAAMVRDFPEDYARYYSQKEYRYNNISQANRNRLLYIDASVDGMKTGFTDAAGYCLIASSKRESRRLISVVLGTVSDSARASESLKILNWGFQFYDAVRLYQKDQQVSALRVWKGTEENVAAGFSSDLVLAVPKGMADKVKAEFVSQQPLLAPVTAGQKVGVVRVSVDGKLHGEFPAFALKAVPLAGIVGRSVDTLRLWLK